jgi:DNA-binding NtrC family response regulator
VSIASEVGHGTVVRLYLPHATGETRVEGASVDSASNDIVGSGFVLVVEDEVEVRRLITDTLRDAGCKVISAPTARDGLRLLEDNPTIQLLLTDIGLPDGVNGIQLAEEARRRCPNLNVVYMTGYVRGAGEPGAQVDPAFPVLNKPFTRDLLVRRVCEGLAQSDPVS